MNIRIKQRISLLLWNKYSVTIDRMNRNPLLKVFYDKNKDTDSLPDRLTLFQYINDNVVKGDSIDYLEFGVYKGDSISSFSALNRNPNSRFYGFDTFTGLPENWFSDFQKGAFSTNGNIPTISDVRVSFIKGMFQDTLSNFLLSFKRTSKKMVIFMDADLYTSTLFVLIKIDPILRKGDVLIFDDFLDPIGEFKAFFDYTSSCNKNFSLIAYVKDRDLNLISKVAVEV